MMRAGVRLRSGDLPAGSHARRKKGNFERGIIHNKRTNSASIAAIGRRLDANINPGSLFAATFSTSPVLDAVRFAGRKGQQVRR